MSLYNFSVFAVDFKIDFIVVKYKTRNYFNFLLIVEIFFVPINDLFSRYVHQIPRRKYILECLNGTFYWYSAMSNWSLMLFNSGASLPIFCLYDLSICESGAWKTFHSSVLSLICGCMSSSICCMKLGVPGFGMWMCWLKCPLGRLLPWSILNYPCHF